MAFVDATVILMKCDKTHKTYAVRVEKQGDGDWARTWAFPIADEVAKEEKYNEQKVVGNLYVTEEYPGCPYCRETRFVMCGKCSKLTCYHGTEQIICEWCGTLSGVHTAESKFDVSGNSF